jgi:hypothetical protein
MGLYLATAVVYILIMRPSHSNGAIWQHSLYFFRRNSVVFRIATRNFRDKQITRECRSWEPLHWFVAIIAPIREVVTATSYFQCTHHIHPPSPWKVPKIRQACRWTDTVTLPLYTSLSIVWMSARLNRMEVSTELCGPGGRGLETPAFMLRSGKLSHKEGCNCLVLSVCPRNKEYDIKGGETE